MADETLPGLTVLVVSDDPHIQQDVRFGVPAGVEVLVARDSRDARLVMNDHVPSVVVVDIQTGSAGGYNLARDMKQTPGLGEVPLLLLLERPQDGWLAKQSVAQLYRTKPVDPAELVADALSLTHS